MPRVRTCLCHIEAVLKVENQALLTLDCHVADFHVPCIEDDFWSEVDTRRPLINRQCLALEGPMYKIGRRVYVDRVVRAKSAVAAWEIYPRAVPWWKQPSVALTGSLFLIFGEL